MKSISIYLANIIERQKLMNYGFPELLKPGASNEEIQKAEKKLGFKLNQELIDLYSSHNGTNYMDLPSGKTGIFPIHNWLDLSNAANHYKIQIEFQEAFYNYETDYTPGSNLFPFLSDGAGNFYWVDLNDDNEYYGQIYWTNTFGEDPRYRCDSLTEFFKGISDAYDSNIFFLDEEGYLDCDWHRWRP